MALEIIPLIYLILEDASLIFNILLFYVLIKQWQKTDNRSFIFLLAFSGIGIFISIVRILSYSISLRTISMGASETLTISILGFLSSGFFLLFIDYFENRSISAGRLSFFTGLVGFFMAGRIVFSLHSEVREMTITIVGTELYYFVYTIISMVPIFFNVVNFIIAFIALRKCMEDTRDPVQITHLKMLQLAAFFLYMFSYIFITVGNFLWDLGFMNELVSLLNSVIPIISNVVGIIVLWYIFSKNDLAAYCTTKMGQMEDNKEQQN